jgi:TolB-like protein/Flp pilus assembly protein TadD
MSFLGEIKRRKVFQVAAVYLVVAWLIMQVIDVINEPLNLPDWFDTAVIVALVIGLPIALILAWAFDVTPEGVVKDQGGHEAAHSSGRGIEYVLIGLVVIALGWLVYRVEFDLGDDVRVQRDGVLPNSVAVLPFENLSLDPEDAFFAAGIHESTLNQLAKIRDLVVIARTSVMQYEQDPPPIPEIAKALNVKSVMEGSVRYANGRVLITAQLIDGRTGAHLWSEEFNRDLANVFAVQSEVAKNIATALQVQLLPDERARIENRPTDSAEAYQHYLYALSLPGAYIHPQFLPAFIESLDRAIAVDPDFAEAYVELARGYYYKRQRVIALEYAQKAIELDPTHGRAYMVLGLIYEQFYVRQEEARAAYERAVELNPNDPDILIDHGRRLAEQTGDYAEAIRSGKRAVAIDPNDASFHQRLGFIYLRAGDLPEATRYLREGIRLDPGRYTTYLNLATVEFLNGNLSAAREKLDRAVQIMASGAIYRVGYLAYLYGLLGDPDQAAKLLARFEELNTNRRRDQQLPLGWAILGTGDKERALRDWTITINGYIDENWRVAPGRISRFRDNWLNDPILEEPEFLELRRRLGFEG